MRNSQHGELCIPIKTSDLLLPSGLQIIFLASMLELTEQELRGGSLKIFYNFMFTFQNQKPVYHAATKTQLHCQKTSLFYDS